MKRSTGFEFVALGAIWGSSFLFTRISGNEFGVLPTAGVRVCIGALVLLPVLWFSGHAAALRQHAGPVLLVGMLNCAFPFSLFAFAVMSISTGLTGILNATVPLFGAVIAWLWLKEQPSKLSVLGLVIGFGGVVTLAVDKASFKSGGSGWAVLACLLATALYGLAASYTKRYLSGVHPLATATGSQIGAALGLALPTFWFWPARNPGASAWLAMAALGVVCTGTAYVLYFRLIERIGPQRAIAVTFLVPMFAVVYGTLFMGERLTLSMLAGGAIVVCGTALSTGLIRAGAQRV